MFWSDCKLLVVSKSFSSLYQTTHSTISTTATSIASAQNTAVRYYRIALNLQGEDKSTCKGMKQRKVS